MSCRYWFIPYFKSGHLMSSHENVTCANFIESVCQLVIKKWSSTLRQSTSEARKYPHGRWLKVQSAKFWNFAILDSIQSNLILQKCNRAKSRVVVNVGSVGEKRNVLLQKNGCLNLHIKSTFFKALKEKRTNNCQESKLKMKISRKIFHFLTGM